MRIGIGYDIHRLVEGREFVLGGIIIPSRKGMLGHSDGDPLIHSIIDAILGATSLGNIGIYFPDTDPKYKNIKSTELLKETMKIIKGYKIINIDSVVICEEPKLTDFVERMKENLGKIMGISKNLISVKPKRKEGLDSTGRNESVEVISVCLLEEEK